MIAGEGGTQNGELYNEFEIRRQDAIARSLYGDTDKIYVFAHNALKWNEQHGSRKKESLNKVVHAVLWLLTLMSNTGRGNKYPNDW